VGLRGLPRRHRVRRGAALGVLAILVEGAIGAALVLFRLTGENDSLARAAVMGIAPGEHLLSARVWSR
jgi:hypothetical protein